MLGAGLAFFRDGTDMVQQALRGVEFYRNESCGKCVPCRIGTEKLTAVTRRHSCGPSSRWRAAWKSRATL